MARPDRPQDPLRHLPAVFALALLQVLLVGCTHVAPAVGSTRPVDPARPDIVLVVIDTLRADHVGVYGYPLATTPHIDELAARGAWFRRAYSHSCWTLPAFASLLTGLYPHEHGAGRDPESGDRFGRITPGAVTLAELLTEQGYRCGAVVNNTFLAPEFGFARGFRGGYDYAGADNEASRSADESVAEALRWLEAERAPAFLLLHFMEPHMDYAPPPSTRGRFTGPARPELDLHQVLGRLAGERRSATCEELEYVKHLYDEEILAADLGVGALMDGLEARGRLDSTVLVVTSDHGEEHFDHGRFEHGHSLFNELTRVPLVVAGPGIGGGEQRSLVQHVDLFQGLLSLGGALPPPGSRGEDLFALLADGSRTGERAVLTEGVLYGAPQVSLTTERRRLGVDLSARRLELWGLDEDGVETGSESLGDAGSENSMAHAMWEALCELRGGDEPAALKDGPVILDGDALAELQALGYVGYRQTAALPSHPPSGPSTH